MWSVPFIDYENTGAIEGLGKRNAWFRASEDVSSNPRSGAQDREEPPRKIHQCNEEITITNKAQKILQSMNRRKALKRWREFSNPRRREKILNEFNRDNLDDVGPIGGAEQGMKVVQEMDEMADLERDVGRKGCPDR